MTTRAVVRNNLKGMLNISGSEYDELLNLAIQEAIRLMEGKRYWFLRATNQVPLSVGAPSVTVPTDFAMMGSVDLLYSGERYTAIRGFELWEYRAFKTRFLTTTTLPDGRPTACSLLNRTLYVNKLTDVAATLDFEYFQRDANELTNDTDTSVWFGREGMHVIRSIAKFIYENEVWDDEQAKQNITASYQAQLDRQHEVYERGSYH